MNSPKSTSMRLYPLKFHPIFKERLWGGSKLGTVLGKAISGDAIGESWELSGVSGNVSVVANGPLEGKSLNELIAEAPEALLGSTVVAQFGIEFPILIKFIDAQKDLSIQLHPHDDLARERHNSFGKTEMWYIMQAEPDAELIVGFNRDIDRPTYSESLESNTLLELLNYEKVAEGDTFFINTGKVHAIGAGILLAEIQQTSDITYRIFDFNRRDKDGNLRELHTELALDAIDYKQKDDFKVEYARTEGVANKMVDCPYFKTNFIKATETLSRDLSSQDSFVIYMCVGGEALLETEGGSLEIREGETVLIPAESKSLRIQSEGVKLLEVTL